ncbi:phage major capsid protein [Azospirillum sp. A39]|uniref:phage major capsid protein n=1 Tax=Azospirillum sp. A39 TaxID=3462279 RepID=UPI0040452FA2
MTIPTDGILGEEALREAAAGSYQDVIRRVEGAVRALFRQAGSTETYAWLRGLWPDHAVFAIDQKGGEARLLSYPYALGKDGAVTLGTPTEVVETFTPLSAATMTEAAGALIEAEAAAEGAPVTRFKVRVIKAGLSGNRNYYPDATLREAVKAGLFEGARVFVKADQEHLAGGGKDVRNLIGRTDGALFVEGKEPDTGEVQATLTLLSPSEPIAVKLREAVAGGHGALFGLSIDADGTARKGKSGIRVAAKLTKLRSVDLIVEPGAGGEVISLIEAQTQEGGDRDAMLRAQLIQTIKASRPELLAGKDVAALGDDELQGIFTEALKPAPAGAPTGPGAASAADPAEIARLVEAKIGVRLTALSAMRERVNRSTLPTPAKVRIIGEFERTEAFTEAQVEERVRDEIAYLAPFATGGRVSGLGGTALVESMEDRRKKIDTMLDAFFDPSHSEHRHALSFKECYAEITGDHRVSGRLRDCDQARLREALGTDSFDTVLGDGIHRRMIADYRQQTPLDAYRNLVTIGNASDFRNMERVRWGGYGDLPEVAEGDPYLELASPDEDDPAVFRVKKRGGTERITIELIKNDDVGVIRRIPTDLGRAAKRTLSRGVLSLFPANRAIADGKALFHADHNNLGTAALSGTSLAARRLAMMQQTSLGSDEPLFIPPKFLWVPAELEETGFNLFRRATETDQTYVQSLNLVVQPVWCWTDPDNWGLSADPMDIPVFELAFLDGREEPELFVQDSPTSGSLFSNDAITYKIRHIWGVVELDYRGVQYSVVP